ncbi:hypothetical protein LCM17_13065 [Cereibacter sphaeroides]|nr:hypothetical protein [Cereibacter sphaeroides]
MDGAAVAPARLTPQKVNEIANDLAVIKLLTQTADHASKARSDNEITRQVGHAIRHCFWDIAPQTMSLEELGAAALDGVVARLANRRAELEARISPYLERGPQ